MTSSDELPGNQKLMNKKVFITIHWHVPDPKAPLKTPKKWQHLKPNIKTLSRTQSTRTPCNDKRSADLNSHFGKLFDRICQSF